MLPVLKFIKFISSVKVNLKKIILTHLHIGVLDGVLFSYDD